MEIQIIHITWHGPYSFDVAKLQQDAEEDYGVYQIYGTHPVYGAGVLLYIGKADKQTFGKRLSQEGWANNLDSETIQIYLGKLGGFEYNISNEEWSQQITIAERLLIYAHTPAVNSSGLNVVFDEKYHDVHILNWGKRRSLYPEVSGKFYSSLYAKEGYATYGTAKA